MHRQIVLPGQLPLDTDLLNTNKNVMIALGALAQSLFGTNTLASGLGVTPTTPASLSVNVAPGSVYALSQVDAVAYGSIPADTADTIVKQGIQLAASQLALTAPTTAGFSVNYLIEAAFSEVDGVPQLLPFYNSTNPQQPYNGPGGNNQQTNTQRQDLVNLVAKAGIAAATGTQSTPSADAGSIPLAVVTVAYGQTQITAANITTVTTNVLPADLLDAIQQNRLDYAVDTGAANAYVIALQPTPSAIPDGFVATFQATNANTGASTLNVNGFGAKPILGGAHSALQGGEIAAAGKVEVMWHSGLASFVLMEGTGGASQVGAATKSNHAMQLGQAVGRLLNVQVFNVAGTYTYTPTPGTNSVIVEVLGAGAGGGGVNATSSTQANASGAGGAGAYIKAKLTSGFSGVTVTVGSAGAGGSAASGNGVGGGTSSFGALASAPGGVGGGGGTATAPSPFITRGGSSTSSSPASSGQILVSTPGAAGAGTLAMQNTSGATVGGALAAGANSIYGSGSIGANGVSPSAATGYGAGGGGILLVFSQPALTGAPGSVGLVQVWEYA